MAKQAVLIIHGIGEQKPMQTLHSFVEAVWSRDESIHHPNGTSEVWSKPDDISDSFELRRLTTGRNRNGIRTDFYEFYWAHLMRGTTLTHVIGWARFLLFRMPYKVPAALRSVYWLLLTAISIMIFFMVNAALSQQDRLFDIPVWLSLIFSAVVVPVTGHIIKSIVGDAARYLHPAPPNVQRRHEIRRAGVELLRNLHQRDYERIVVVGHSLGTVIGYDILKYFWAETHNVIDPESTLTYEKLDELEAIARGDDRLPDSENIQQAQIRYFNELKSNGNSWRVSDFVTLGSPLTHADILLANDTDDRKRKQHAREFPTCLPELEKHRNGNQTFSFFSKKTYKKDGTLNDKKYRIPHHAAVFAPTCWTNIYFPVKNVVKGDLIAGPLAEVFGSGIRDVNVETNQRLGCFSHTLYWTAKQRNTQPDSHIVALRQALDLADDRGAIAIRNDTE